MTFFDSIRLLARPAPAQPTIDDWVAAGENRRVEFKAAHSFDIRVNHLPSATAIQCRVAGNAGGANFWLDGYGATSGDAFTDALRRLQESGVAA